MHVALERCSVVLKNMAASAAAGMRIFYGIDEAFFRVQSLLLACAYN